METERIGGPFRTFEVPKEHSLVDREIVEEYAWALNAQTFWNDQAEAAREEKNNAIGSQEIELAEGKLVQIQNVQTKIWDIMHDSKFSISEHYNTDPPDFSAGYQD